MLVNPFDMTYADDGSARRQRRQRQRRGHRERRRYDSLLSSLCQLEIADQPSYPVEAVPTGIIRMDDEYWVTLLGGCPYPAGGGRLVAIDEQRNQRTVLDGLNMPIDVAMGPDGNIWVLEFATFPPGGDCFSGADYQVESGRLSRLHDDGTLETVIDNLNFPGAVLPMPDGSLYVSEVLPGRVLHITFAASQQRLPSRNADRSGSHCCAAGGKARCNQRRGRSPYRRDRKPSTATTARSRAARGRLPDERVGAAALF